MSKPFKQVIDVLEAGATKEQVRALIDLVREADLNLIMSTPRQTHTETNGIRNAHDRVQDSKFSFERLVGLED